MITMELRRIHLLLAFFIVGLSLGSALPNMVKNSSSGILVAENENTASRAHPVAVLEDLMDYYEGNVSGHPLTTRNFRDPSVGRQKRDTWTGEINEMYWTPDTPTSVYLGWTGEGDLYDLLIYSGYPVGGGPGLPLYRSVSGIKAVRNGGLYRLRNLQRNSDYLVHIKARKSDGREGGWMSFPKVTTD